MGTMSTQVVFYQGEDFIRVPRLGAAQIHALISVHVPPSAPTSPFRENTSLQPPASPLSFQPCSRLLGLSIFHSAPQRPPSI